MVIGIIRVRGVQRLLIRSLVFCDYTMRVGKRGGVCCESVLRLEWFGNNDCPYAKLICNAGYVGSIADITATSAAKINDRMSELIHGKGYIGLHNLMLWVGH